MRVVNPTVRCLAAVLLLLLGLPAWSAAQVRISEVLAAPASDWNGDGEVDYKNDEWVEIENIGPQPAGLDGLYLKDATGDTYHYGFSGVLQPGEVLLVTGSMAVEWQAVNGAGSSGLSLNNGGDTLELWRDVAEPRVLEVLDHLPIPSHAGGSDRALGRHPQNGEWVLFDGLNPYAGELLPPSTGCLPSPGTPNVCETVPLDEATWGLLKSFHLDLPPR